MCCPPASNGVMNFEIEKLNSACLIQRIPRPLEDDRFMDDRFHLWLQSLEQICKYNIVCNSFSLVFTTDDPPSKSKDFQDLTIFILDGKIETKLYRNPVSKSNFYLNYFSSHPSMY
jgi:hypothetical protein